MCSKLKAAGLKVDPFPFLSLNASVFQPLEEIISHTGLGTQGWPTHADLPCTLSQDITPGDNGAQERVGKVS